MKKKLIIITIIILLVIAITQAPRVYKKILKNYYPITYSEEVEKYAQKYNIEKYWIYALIKAESNFKKESISRKWSYWVDAVNGKHSFRGF